MPTPILVAAWGWRLTSSRKKTSSSGVISPDHKMALARLHSSRFVMGGFLSDDDNVSFAAWKKLRHFRDEAQRFGRKLCTDWAHQRQIASLLNIHHASPSERA